MRILMLVGEDTVGKRLHLLKNFDVIVSVWPDEKDRVNRARELLGSSMMFDEVEKAVVLRSLDEWNKKDLKKLREIVEDVKAEEGLNLVLDVQDDRRLKEYDFPIDERREFRLPKPWEDEKWVQEVQILAEEMGMQMEAEAARALLNRLGQNKELIHAELCKLSNRGVREISTKDVQEYTPVLKPEGLEDFLDLVGRRSQHAVEVLEELLITMEVSLVVAGLYNTFRDLLTLKLRFPQGESVNWKTIKRLSSELKISTGRVAKFLGFRFKGSSSAMNILDLWEVKEIEKALIELQKLEQGIKDGVLEPRVALHIFLQRFLCQNE